MKKSEWSDKELMELLKEMPKIEDYRHPRDIYQNLPIKRRKKMPWLLPGLATAAALLLFFILIPKLMDSNQFSLDHAKQESTQEAKVAKENNDSSGTANGDTQKDQATIMKKAELSNEKIAATAIYDDVANDENVLTYWVPDDQTQNLVPVSTIVSNSEGKDWLTLFNENMANLRETEWGLTDYYPLKATLSYDKAKETVVVDIPAGTQYGQGSGNEISFINSLKNMAASNSTAQKIKFMTNSNLGFEAGNNYYEEITVDQIKNHAYFLYYSDKSDLPFLVPSPEQYKDIKSALQAMGSSIETRQLQGITLGINDVSSSGQTLTISFNENSGMNNDQQTVWSFEAILLTAKEFGFEKVLVNNPPIDKLGPFDLTQEIKVPIAPNLRETK